MFAVEEIVARMFTTENPATGSQPPPEIAWVVFANGTVFFTTPTPALPASSTLAQIADAAVAALLELGPVRAGTPSADFNPTLLDSWFPGSPVWFVGFCHPNIATVVVMDGDSLIAGLDARSRRQLDHDEQNIVCVRGFNGAIAH